MDGRIRVAMIYGSTREGRLCDKVAGWVGEQIWSGGGFSLDPVDPREFGNLDATAVAALESRLARADAFVVVTPEYNHGYPAPLKALIDAAYEPWQGKPVGFVSYGGLSGGLRAVEQLRQVFAELHAVTIRDSLALVNAWEQFDEAGRLRDDTERARRRMRSLLAQLHWWASALRTARRERPYAELAA